VENGQWYVLARLSKSRADDLLQNKTLSDPSDPILAAQGVSYLKRTAISLGYITLAVKHYRNDGVEKIDIDQTITGGFSTSEGRILDWQDREHEDDLFGAVIGKSKREEVKNVGPEYLKKGWTEDTIEHGVIYSHVLCEKPKWTAIQVSVIYSQQSHDAYGPE
jgi:hypothetical protein